MTESDECRCSGTHGPWPCKCECHPAFVMRGGWCAPIVFPEAASSEGKPCEPIACPPIEDVTLAPQGESN